MALQRIDELRNLSLSRPARQLSDLFRRRLSCKERQQHILPRDTKYVAQHARNFDRSRVRT
jgi:hypothetical protein